MLDTCEEIHYKLHIDWLLACLLTCSFARLLNLLTGIGGETRATRRVQWKECWPM